MEQKNIDDLVRDLITLEIPINSFSINILLIIDNLKLPPEIINNPDIHRVEVRKKGLEAILQYNYVQSYRAYTLKTLFRKK